jgi:serine/threonine-protein kinase
VSPPGPDWARAKAIFLEAVELPEGERRACVARACAGDAELEREVESLLESDGAVQSFGEIPAAVLLSPVVDAGSPAVRLTPGTRLGAYEITGFIAAGGMGQVYRARHSVLGREVAIKIAGMRLDDDAAKRRLIREARTASTLSHPNICTIYEVGEAGGVPFFVMEYLPGRTLAQVIREGPPDLTETLGIGMQIAAALADAHARAIVHRDLKSSNVVIDASGRAKVLDFGLARRIVDDTVDPESTITSANVVAGTLSHMAPEVLRGARGDERSDIWALGVVLYEVATGGLPFTGETGLQITSAILTDAPRPMGRRVPLALRLVIERCLNKDPDGRYQRAQAVHDALHAIHRRRSWPVVGRLLLSVSRRGMYGAGALALAAALLVALGMRLGTARVAGGASPTVAMLPIEASEGDVGAGYYVEGVTDALISQLGAAVNVRVLSRTSTALGVSSARTPAQLGDRLSADVLVYPSLRRSHARVAISVRAVRPGDGQVLWSETYERDDREILALQADVVRGVALAIQSTLRPGMRERLAAVRAVDPAVYEEYLKGRHEWNKRTTASLHRAIAHLTRAVELDDSYAPAHAALADCYNQLATVMVGSGAPTQWRPLAAAEAVKALRIDPQSAEAHAALGFVRHYQLRWHEAERELRRAIELNPSYALARLWYANLLMSRSRYDEALEQVYAAREIDPFSLVVNTNVAWVLTHARRYDDAIAQLRETLALDSTYVQAQWRMADALAAIGRSAEAVEHAARVVALSDSTLTSLALHAQMTANAGNRAAARVQLARIMDRGRAEYVPPGSIAEVYAALGDLDSAVTWMERAYAEGSNMIAYIGSPEHEPLRRHPGFRALLSRAGLK